MKLRTFTSHYAMEVRHRTRMIITACACQTPHSQRRATMARHTFPPGQPTNAAPVMSCLTECISIALLYTKTTSKEDCVWPTIDTLIQFMNGGKGG